MTRPRHICELLAHAAGGDSADKPAFVWPDRTFTWAQFEQGVRALAGRLRALGIGGGDSVAVLLPNLPLHAMLSFAAPLLGAIYLPLNLNRTLSAIVGLLEPTAPAIIFIPEQIRADFDRTLHENGLPLRTAAVTMGGEIRMDGWPGDADPFDGDPAGDRDAVCARRLSPGMGREVRIIPLRHRHLLHATDAVRSALQVVEGDVLYGAYPFATARGQLMQMLLPARVAATVHADIAWAPARVADLIRREKLTAFAGLAPDFADVLAELGREPAPDRAQSNAETGEGESGARRLRFALCAGPHIDRAVLARFEQMLGCPVATAAGMLETAGLLAVNPAHIDGSNRIASGRPVSGLDVTVRDDGGRVLPPDTIGQLWVRGPNVFDGYENEPNGVSSDGWFRTSTLGSIDFDGWLYLKCRKDDRILRGGFPVYPEEVEAVLNSHPSVYESAVVGTPDPAMGERVTAFIVLRPDQALVESDLKRHCETRLSRYKIPGRFVSISSLPRSADGLILRGELREREKTR